MRMAMAFGKMMNAWCQQHGIPLDAAQFTFDGRVLQPSDTPLSCGWDTKGVLSIQARPLEEEGSSSEGPAPSGGAVISAPSPEEPHKARFMWGQTELRVDQTPYDTGWRPGAGGIEVHAMPRTEPAPKDGKSDSDKDSSDDSSDDSSESGDTVASKKSAEASKEDPDPESFWSGAGSWSAGSDAKGSTDSGKESALHKKRGLPDDSGGSPTKKTRTLPKKVEGKASLQLSAALRVFTSNRLPLLLQALPHLSEAEQERLVTAEFHALSPGERRPFEEEAKRVGMLEEESRGPKRLVPAPAPATTPATDAKVSIVVVAHGIDGEAELKFTMRQVTPFSKMMTAWCSQYGIAEQETCFVYDGRALLPTDCAENLKPGSEFIVRAVPRGSPEAKAALRAAEHAAASAPSRSGAETAPPVPKRPLGALALFMRARSPALLEKRRDLRSDTPQLMKLLSAAWNRSSQEERQPFEAMAEGLKTKYVTEMRAYFRRFPELAKQAIERRKARGEKRKLNAGGKGDESSEE